MYILTETTNPIQMTSETPKRRTGTEVSSNGPQWSHDQDGHLSYHSLFVNLREELNKQKLSVKLQKNSYPSVSTYVLVEK